MKTREPYDGYDKACAKIRKRQETGHLKKDEYGSLTLTTKALKELNQ